MTGIMSSGCPPGPESSTAALSNRVLLLVEVDDTHAQRKFSLLSQSFWNLRTTNIMSVVNHAGWKPHCSSAGNISLGFAVVTEAVGDDLKTILLAWETSETFF